MEIIVLICSQYCASRWGTTVTNITSETQAVNRLYPGWLCRLLQLYNILTEIKAGWSSLVLVGWVGLSGTQIPFPTCALSLTHTRRKL